jgi:hypothetical protein
MAPKNPTHNFTHTVIGRSPFRIRPRQGTCLEPRSSRQGLRPCTDRAWSESANDRRCPALSSGSLLPCSVASSTGCVEGCVDPSDAHRGWERPPLSPQGVSSWSKIRRTNPYPDGTIIAALHYRHVPSEENNKIFGQAQSFVPGAPTNVQFMVKDSKNTPQPAAGDSATSRMTNLAMRRL